MNIIIAAIGAVIGWWLRHNNIIAPANPTTPSSHPFLDQIAKQLQDQFAKWLASQQQPPKS
jgi:hypothetical protein